MKNKGAGDKRVKVSYEIVVEDKNGKKLKSVKSEARSLLRNFLEWIASGLFSQARGLTDTSGVSQIISAYVEPSTGVSVELVNMDCEADAGNDDYGIVVGVGSDPVSPSDYALSSKIAHGTASGQLQYGECSFEVLETVGQTVSVKVKRAFTNGSGADITIYEIGLISRWYKKVGATEEGVWYFLMIRDVLATPVTVPDGATLTVRYIIQVTA